ncbi:MAG: hypothetical protein WC514_03355 [Candidatus Paceibacterota bacterium]
MPSENEAKRIFDKSGVIVNDHVVYAKKEDGWYHGRQYFNKDAIYPHTRYVSLLCKHIARHAGRLLRDDIGVVVGPTVGGVSLSQWTAYWLSSHREVLSVYADEEDVVEQYKIKGEELRQLGQNINFIASGAVEITLAPYPNVIEEITYMLKVGTHRVMRRGYDNVVKGKNCFVVEDVIHTGKTVLDTINATRRAGGFVRGVGSLCNSSGGKVTADSLGVPELFSLLERDTEIFREEECLICKEEGPESVRTDIGKGREFLLRRGLLKV